MSQPTEHDTKLQSALRWGGQWILSSFFRTTEIEGRENLPANGPTIVVANHGNSLVDGALLAVHLPRPVRVLAAGSVWGYKPIVPLLNLAGTIPVFRRYETANSIRKNAQTFGAAADHLTDGGALVIFPEGVSHNEPGLQPVKSGAARIALHSLKHLGEAGNLNIVPVGLVFDAKSRFRSRALIRIGKPINVTDHLAGLGSVRNPAAAVRSLTDAIARSMEETAPSYPSWEEARLIGRAADIWMQPQSSLPRKMELAIGTRFRQRLSALLSDAANGSSARAKRLLDTLAAYDLELSRAGLRDPQVAATFPACAVARTGLTTATEMILRFPVALIGMALNVAPVFVARLMSHGRDRDKKATWSIFASLFLFPLFWLAQALALGMMTGGLTGPWLGALAGLGVLLLSPILGRVALIFMDQFSRSVHETKGWWRLRTQRNVTDRLRALRSCILRQIEDLLRNTVHDLPELS
ncbi:MAG: lysophospholipid acyltransferase family protein [Pseudomonadota bacterium]